MAYCKQSVINPVEQFLFPFVIEASIHNEIKINQNLSETAQNPARFLEKNTLAHSVRAVMVI